MNKPLKICFVGSGELAAPILESLLKDNRFEVKEVISQPDKPAGRKKVLTPCPVGAYCQTNNINCLKPTNINTPEVINHLKEMKLDFIIVASFGQILRSEFLSLPKLGCINVHASILPKWRGASPITAVILNGEDETGICFMAMDEGLDTGDVYHCEKIPLNKTETTNTLEEKMGIVAAQTIGDTLIKISNDEIQATPQNHAEFTYAHKIKKEHGKIDWTDSAQNIEQKVRAYTPWPRTYFHLPTEFGGFKIQITNAEVVKIEKPEQYQAGDVVQADKKGLIICCGQEALYLCKIIPEGKKEMASADFLRGHQIPVRANLNPK